MAGKTVAVKTPEIKTASTSRLVGCLGEERRGRALAGVRASCWTREVGGIGGEVGSALSCAIVAAVAGLLASLSKKKIMLQLRLIGP